jgi:hypothetical protein
MIGQETRVAFISVWLIVSLILLFTIIASHFLSATAILSASTTLRLPYHDTSTCFLCGMTRAFIAISHGHLDEAVAFNDWSVALYGFIIVNELSAAFFLTSQLHKWFLSQRAAIQSRRKTSTQREIESCRYSV